MKYRNSPFSYFAPLMLWTDLGAKTLEMMMASTQVIAHRTRRIALSGATPNARDRREFARMGEEKVEAGAKSAKAIAAHMLTMSWPWNAWALNHGLRNSAALLSLASSRTPGEFIARQLALARSLGQSTPSAADFSKSARLAHRALQPIHAKAVANAKRLGR